MLGCLPVHTLSAWLFPGKATKCNAVIISVLCDIYIMQLNIAYATVVSYIWQKHLVTNTIVFGQFTYSTAVKFGPVSRKSVFPKSTRSAKNLETLNTLWQSCELKPNRRPQVSVNIKISRSSASEIHVPRFLYSDPILRYFDPIGIAAGQSN